MAMTALATTGPAWPVPRTPLALLPTPLVAAPRLASELGVGSLLIKRDDLTGFAMGGNKIRSLEFLLAAATLSGADTVVTGGAPTSNFCAAAAAAALRAGLGCALVLAGEPDRCPGPALALAQSWGASVRWTGAPGRDSVDAELPKVAAELAALGQHPYVMPRGGATGVGAIGYALAAFELREQLAARGAPADPGAGPADPGATRVVVAVGSGGTLAGLVAGNALLGRPWTLLGCSASRPPEEATARVLTLARECSRLLAEAGVRGPGETAETGEVGARSSDVTVADVRGPGHSLASAEGETAAELAMRSEGLMTDPVYTAKALSLVSRCRGAGTVVFWHTGGILDVTAAAIGQACR